MIYLIAAIILLAWSLLLRLRVRFELEDRSRSVLFAGLGRSGLSLDFVSKHGTVRVAGIPLRRFNLTRGAESEAQKPEKAGPKKKSRKRRQRKLSLSDIAQHGPTVLKALGSFALGVVRDAIIEEAEGEVEAGFESPDLTGISFGYYQAAAAAVPALGQRLHFAPVWDGPAFSGGLRIAVALPLYRLVWRTLVLTSRLPLRKLLKLAIGRKRGDQDGQQRS